MLMMIKTKENITNGGKRSSSTVVLVKVDNKLLLYSIVLKLLNPHPVMIKCFSIKMFIFVLMLSISPPCQPLSVA